MASGLVKPDVIWEVAGHKWIDSALAYMRRNMQNAFILVRVGMSGLFIPHIDWIPSADQNRSGRRIVLQLWSSQLLVSLLLRLLLGDLLDLQGHLLGGLVRGRLHLGLRNTYSIRLLLVSLLLINQFVLMIKFMEDRVKQRIDVLNSEIDNKVIFLTCGFILHIIKMWRRDGNSSQKSIP